MLRLAVAAAILTGAGFAAASTAPADASQGPAIPPLPSRAQLVAERGRLLQLAEQGIRDAKTHWWNAKLGWYNEDLDENFPPEPLLMLWSAFQLFEAVDAVAIADPTYANVTQAAWFANMAERYYNPTLKPVGAYAYYMGRRDSEMPYYFDDNGWFGIAFLDAFQATHHRRYLVDAEKGFRFLAVAGWAQDGGGFWWNTKHDLRAARRGHFHRSQAVRGDPTGDLPARCRTLGRMGERVLVEPLSRPLSEASRRRHRHVVRGRPDGGR